MIVASGAALRYVGAGVISAPASMPKYARLRIIGADLEEVIAEFKPDVACIEAGFVNGQMGALVSGAARGVAAYLCARAGLAVFEYSATAVKKVVTSAGNATKESVARMVQLNLRMACAPALDAGDALAVAIAHARRAPGKKAVG